LAEATKKVLGVKSARILEAWSLSFATCPNNSSPELEGILVDVQRPNPPQQLQQPCHQHNLNLEGSEQVEYNLVYNSYEYEQSVESVKGRLKNHINFWKTQGGFGLCT
jgi:hypothetical protein